MSCELLEEYSGCSDKKFPNLVPFFVKRNAVHVVVAVVLGSPMCQGAVSSFSMGKCWRRLAFETHGSPSVMFGSKCAPQVRRSPCSHEGWFPTRLSIAPARWIHGVEKMHGALQPAIHDARLRQARVDLHI